MVLPLGASTEWRNDAPDLRLVDAARRLTLAAPNIMNISKLLIELLGRESDYHSEAVSVAAFAATCRRANALLSPGLAEWGTELLDATLDALVTGEAFGTGRLHRGSATSFAGAALFEPSSLRAHALEGSARLVSAVLATFGDATCTACQQRALGVLSRIIRDEAVELGSLCIDGLGELFVADARCEAIGTGDAPRPWPTLWDSIASGYTSVDREDGLSREAGEIVEEVFPWYELQDADDYYAEEMMNHGQLATRMAVLSVSRETSGKGLGAGDRVDRVLKPLLEFLDVGLCVRGAALHQGQRNSHEWQVRSFAAQSALTVLRAYDSEPVLDAFHDADVVWDLARLLADEGVAVEDCAARGDARRCAQEALGIYAARGMDFAVHAFAALLEFDTLSGADLEKQQMFEAVKQSERAATVGILAVHDCGAKTCEDTWNKAAADCGGALSKALMEAVEYGDLAERAALLRCGAFEALARVACDPRTNVKHRISVCGALTHFFESKPTAEVWLRAHVWRFIVRATVRFAEDGPITADKGGTICVLLRTVLACATSRPLGGDAEAEFRDCCYVLLDATQPGRFCAAAPALPAALLVIMECCLPAPGRPHVSLWPARAGPRLVMLLGNETELEALKWRAASRKHVCSVGVAAAAVLCGQVFDPDGSLDAQSQLMDAPSIVERRVITSNGELWLRHAATAIDPLLAALRYQAPGASFAGALLGALCEHDADGAYDLNPDNDVPLSSSLCEVLFKDEITAAVEKDPNTAEIPPAYRLRWLQKHKFLTPSMMLDALRREEREGRKVAQRLLDARCTKEHAAPSMAAQGGEDGASAPDASSAASKKKTRRGGKKKKKPQVVTDEEIDKFQSDSGRLKALKPYEFMAIFEKIKALGPAVCEEKDGDGNFEVRLENVEPATFRALEAELSDRLLGLPVTVDAEAAGVQREAIGAARGHLEALAAPQRLDDVVQDTRHYADGTLSATELRESLAAMLESGEHAQTLWNLLRKAHPHADRAERRRTCSNCEVVLSIPEAPALRICAGCRRVRYCSPECQAAHWQSHHRHVCLALAQQRLGSSILRTTPSVREYVASMTKKFLKLTKTDEVSKVNLLRTLIAMNLSFAQLQDFGIMELPMAVSMMASSVMMRDEDDTNWAEIDVNEAGISSPQLAAHLTQTWMSQSPANSDDFTEDDLAELTQNLNPLMDLMRKAANS